MKILHLSDLHFNTDYKPTYKSSFFKKIKEINDPLDYVIITGDIADSGAKHNYTAATSMLNELCNTINVKHQDVIIVPGNHDIYVPDIIKFADEHHENRTLACYENKIKHVNFCDFYNDFYSECKISFDPTKIIFRKVQLTDGMNCICINSNYGLITGHDDEDSGIDAVQLETEYALLKDDSDFFDENTTIAIIHDISPGNGKTDDTDAITYLRDNGIEVFITGHTHEGKHLKISADEGEKVIYNGFLFNYSKYDKKCDGDLGFYIYDISETPKTFNVKRECYLRERINENLINCSTKQDSEIKKHHINEQSITSAHYETEKQIMVQPDIKNTKIESDNEDLLKESSINDGSAISEFSDYLLDLIKKEKLLVSGHFHWSPNSRSHSLVNTAKLLSPKDNIRLIQQMILGVLNDQVITYEIKKPLSNTTLIGFGMEGNILSSFLLTDEDIASMNYTYIPHPQKSHNKKETQINYDNIRDNIIIIIDVVSSGNTIANIIEDLYSKCEKIKSIVVMSLIHKSKLKPATSFLKEHLNNTKSLNKNVYYHCLSFLSDNTCQYDDLDDCDIYTKGLEKVYKLYDEEEQNENS